jgi:gliding motility-associated-like protein
MVNGAYTYTWSPSGSLNDPNIPNPVATPTQSTRYVVYGIDTVGCQNTDTVNVNINPRDNLMVPSGFTPNGDGLNDEFKVTNLTFQKVMEFRVFNRWGQEIFSTTDGKKGWDGRWKGVPQDMGTYQYIIRIGFPDGFVETYKGDVTLIR